MGRSVELDPQSVQRIKSIRPIQKTDYERLNLARLKTLNRGSK